MDSNEESSDESDKGIYETDIDNQASKRRQKIKNQDYRSNEQNDCSKGTSNRWIIKGQKNGLTTRFILKWETSEHKEGTRITEIRLNKVETKTYIGSTYDCLKEWINDRRGYEWVKNKYKKFYFLVPTMLFLVPFDFVDLG